MNQPPSPPKRHSFRPLLFAPPQGSDAMRETIRPKPLTTQRGEGPARSSHESHVRLRAMPPAADIDFLDAQDLLDELSEDQLNLAMSVACLERAAEQAPRDPSARAALRTLAARIEDLAALRDALARVLEVTVDARVQRMFVPDAPLSDYVRGVYAWAHAVARALDQLATSMRSLQPDWALLRWRLEEAKNFHFDDLLAPARNEIARMKIAAAAGSFGASPPDMAAVEHAVERLFATARTFEQHLDERFG